MSREAPSSGRLATTIAIDGPAGAGKSTIGARLAELLGFLFFDSGVLYRAVTLAALHAGIDLRDEARLAALATDMDLAFAPPHVDDGRQVTVRLDGADVTWAIRQPAVNESVSIVSAHPAVRQALLERQRAVGRRGRVVMVGRDIGTTVVPEAGLKIYLDASPEVRGRRRRQELAARGEATDEATVLAGVVQRDRLDSERAASPLRPATDAVWVASDDLGIGEVIERVLAHYQVATTGGA